MIVIRGILFDMDGTLVDSQLDFDAMRREMELPPEMPILEAVTRLPPQHAERCRAILDRHEREGVLRGALLPGVAELLAELRLRGIRLAIATRNSRLHTDATLRKLRLQVEFALTRDDGPVKPDPWAAVTACSRWDLSPGLRRRDRRLPLRHRMRPRRRLPHGAPHPSARSGHLFQPRASRPAAPLARRLPAPPRLALVADAASVGGYGLSTLAQKGCCRSPRVRTSSRMVAMLGCAFVCRLLLIEQAQRLVEVDDLRRQPDGDLPRRRRVT